MSVTSEGGCAANGAAVIERHFHQIVHEGSIPSKDRTLGTEDDRVRGIDRVHQLDVPAGTRTVKGLPLALKQRAVPSSRIESTGTWRTSRSFGRSISVPTSQASNRPSPQGTKE